MAVMRTIVVQSVLLLYTIVTPSRSSHIKLVHRDSPLSPFHNPDEIPLDRAKKSFERSISRHAYLSGRKNTIGSTFQGGIEPDNGEYLLKFSIGTPPVHIHAIMDTASDLVWTQCIPCKSCTSIQTNHPIFDPSRSLTYRNLSCSSPYCTTLLPNWRCDSSYWCNYIYSYTDFSHSIGSLATDVFTFETSDEGTFPLYNIVFGCGNDNENTSPGRDTGILGLGNHALSLISQMGFYNIEPKFTYCFGNHSNPNTESHLILGNGVFLEGKTTPLKITNGRYSLDLEGISVGTKRLAIPPGTFSYNPSSGGVIIDTGTAMTFLAQDAYYRLIEELERQLELEMDVLPDPPYWRCYTGKISNIVGYNGVVFQFAGGMNVILDRWNLFMQVKDEEFCLGVLPASIGGVSIIGNLFQQFFSVGYDLVGRVVSFEQIDCNFLD